MLGSLRPNRHTSGIKWPETKTGKTESQFFGFFCFVFLTSETVNSSQNNVQCNVISSENHKRVFIILSCGALRSLQKLIVGYEFAPIVHLGLKQKTTFSRN